MVQYSSQYLGKSDVTFLLTSTTTLPIGHHRCGACNICPLTKVTKLVDFPDKGFTHHLSSFSNCKSYYCVYLLECQCGKRYIGSTICQLQVRIQEHISRIARRVLEAPLVQHFVTEGHKSNGLNVVVLEVLQPKTDLEIHKVLLQCKSYWIF